MTLKVPASKRLFALVVPFVVNGQQKTSVDVYLKKSAIEKISLIISLANEDASLYDEPKKSEIRKVFNDKESGRNIPTGVLEVNSAAVHLVKDKGVDPKKLSVNNVVDQYIVDKFGLPPKLEKH